MANPDKTKHSFYRPLPGSVGQNCTRNHVLVTPATNCVPTHLLGSVISSVWVAFKPQISYTVFQAKELWLESADSRFLGSRSWGQETGNHKVPICFGSVCTILEQILALLSSSWRPVTVHFAKQIQMLTFWRHFSQPPINGAFLFPEPGKKKNVSRMIGLLAPKHFFCLVCLLLSQNDYNIVSSLNTQRMTTFYISI